jgi:hypothetical protein
MSYRAIIIAGVAVLVCALLAGSTVMAKGNGKGGVTATIEFANTSGTFTAASATWPAKGDTVSFAVSASVHKERDLYLLWVANKCFQDGTIVYAEHHPVTDGLSGPFTLGWRGDGAAECTAYVWMFPDTETPLRGASMTYSAGP